MGKLGNIVSATMFPEVGKQEDIGRNIMFPQQCFLVCPGLYIYVVFYYLSDDLIDFSYQESQIYLFLKI